MTTRSRSGEPGHHEPRGPLHDLRPAAPPAELRATTLRAARSALQRRAAPDLWDRLWASAAAKWSWGAVAGLLVVGHLGLSLGDRAGEPTAADDDGRLVTTLEQSLGTDERAELASWIALHRPGRLPAPGIAAPSSRPLPDESTLEVKP